MLTFVVVRQVTGVPGPIDGNFTDVPVRRDILNHSKYRKKDSEQKLHLERSSDAKGSKQLSERKEDTMGLVESVTTEEKEMRGSSVPGVSYNRGTAPQRFLGLNLHAGSWHLASRQKHI